MDRPAPTAISPAEFDALYADGFYERVKGVVIKMSPVSEDHDRSTRLLTYLLGFYLSFNPIGQLRQAPFMLRDRANDIDREPDLMLILATNPVQPSPTMMQGAPDLCIEVVSKESIARDYAEKLTEYERLGVGEYWIIDPLRQRATFHRLGSDGHYDLVLPDADGIYRTPLLPKLTLRVADLFRVPPPDAREIFRSVEVMFAD